jgi:hypothetical protein
MNADVSGQIPLTNAGRRQHAGLVAGPLERRGILSTGGRATAPAIGTC